MLGMLRERRKARQEAQTHTNETEREAFIRDMATGKNVDEAVIEKFVSDAPHDTVSCPKNPTHSIRQTGVSKRAGGTTNQYICDSCGTSFSANAPKPRTDDGRMTIEELEAAIALFHQRAEWATAQKERPALEKKRDKFTSEIVSLNQKIKALEKERDDLVIRRDDLQHQVERIDGLARRLRETATPTREERELRAKLSALGRRKREIHAELWGSASVGDYSHPDAQTVGWRWVVNDVEIRKLMPSDSPREIARREKLVRQKIAARKEVDALEKEWNRLELEIGAVDRQLDELQQGKLNP